MKKQTVVSKLFKAKAAYHNGLARLPFKKKIEILVKLQHIACAAKPPGSRIRQPWKLN